MSAFETAAACVRYSQFDVVEWRAWRGEKLPKTANSGPAPNPLDFLTSRSEVPTLAPLSSSACGRPRRGAAASAGWQVVGASRQVSRAASRPQFPRHSLSEAPGMILGVRSSEDTGMPTGTIARLLIDKGFGFIRDEGGIEHFFHRSSVRGAVFELLREGQRVEFTQEESGKGPRAGEVRLLEG